MANVIKPKRSYTATTVPTGLVAGEIAVNATDGKIWICNAAGNANVLVSSLTRSDHTGTLAVASGGTGVTTSTGSGNNVLSTSPTLVTPILGTPTSGTLTNCTFPTLNQNTTGSAASLSATLAVASGGTGVTTSTGSGNNVLSTSPTLVTPILGTPTSGTLTNCTFPTLNQNTTGSAATVTTNANLTGPITSVGNATSIASQTGTGTKFVVDTSPTLVTPTIGAATATTVNKITITAPATGATLTIVNGATLTASATASVSGTNTGDNATNTTYSGLVSNATHTGDATGSTALTVVKINGVLMSGLATGILKNTTSTGVPSIATAGTDYVAPSGALGTPTSGTLTNCTFPTLNQNTTGSAASLSATLAVASGGTGVTTSTGSGNNVLSTSPTLVTPILGTPTSGTLTNCTFPTLNQNTTGSAASLSATLAVASGGTGLATLTANNVILGNGTSAPTFVAPSTSGNLLTSNGTTWASTAPAAQMPTGALMPYAGASAPTGYLLCDGSSVSSSTYLALHAVISNTYGGTAYSGAGALSFNLPDLRGRLPMGAGTGTGQNASGTGAPSGTAQTARTRGQWLGEETHLLTTAELASHTHANTVSGGNTSTAGGSHSHTGFSSSLIKYVGSGGDRGDLSAGGIWSTNTSGVTTGSVNIDHLHTFTPSIDNVAAGGNSRHAIIPPVVVMNYIIKT